MSFALLALILITLVTLALAALDQLEGGIGFALGNWQVTIGWFDALVLLALAFLFVRFVAWLVSTLLFGPERFLSRRAAGKRAFAQQELGRALLAMASGDVDTARRAARRAEAYMKDHPLVYALKSDLYRAEGRESDRQRLNRAMLDNPQTKALGLKGLFEQAIGESNREQAMDYAREALAQNPATDWALGHLYREACLGGDWDGALGHLGALCDAGLIAEDARQEARTALLVAASEAHADDSPRALSDAQEAFRLAPAFAPAAVRLSRLLASRGERAKSKRVLSKSWKQKPHPMLVQAFAEGIDITSGADLIPIRRFIGAPKASGGRLSQEVEECLVLLASLAARAKLWSEVDRLLSSLGENLTEGACILKAACYAESGERDQARRWLSRALRAPPDRLWVSGTMASRRWFAVGPDGVPGTFRWERPTRSGLSPAIISALDQELSQDLPYAPDEAARLASEDAQVSSEPRPPIHPTFIDRREDVPLTPDDPGPI